MGKIMNIDIDGIIFSLQRNGGIAETITDPGGNASEFVRYSSEGCTLE